MKMLHLLVLFPVALASVASDEPTKFPGLVSWFTSNGGILDPRIKIGYDDKGIRGMIATDTIPQNTVIINCPGDLALSKEVDDPCEYVETIIEHLKAGEESKWFKYFDFDDSLGSRIPSEWKDGSQALDELQGLPPTGETHRHINWYKSSCKEGRDIDHWEMRAFKTFLTRAADIGLIPIYDLMNHHNGLINTRLERTDDGKGLKVITSTDISPNEQIWNTYARSGWESSIEVFLTYGFVEDYPQLWQWSDDELDKRNQENADYHLTRYTGNGQRVAFDPNSSKFEILILSPTLVALYPSKELVSILGNGQRSMEEWEKMIAEHHKIIEHTHIADIEQSARALLEHVPTSIQEDEEILQREKYVFDKVNRKGRIDTNKLDVIQAIQYRLAFKKALQLTAEVVASGSVISTEL